MGIFKAYDIRGIYPNELNEETAYKIGRAFVKLLKAKEVLVGNDMRSSSPSLFESVAKGITDEGADVVHAGLVDTPMFYFCAKDYPAALMVTASHNPGVYNGMKCCGRNASPITYENGLEKMGEMVAKNNFAKPSAKKGRIVKKDFMDAFIEFNLKYAKGLKRLKVVADTANGMGGLTFPAVFSRINCDFQCLYPELDGNFPNHEANPLIPQNLKDLRDEVIIKKADLGVAPDGDADRCMFLDEKGNTVPGDLITALIAQRLIKDNPKSAVLYDLRASRVVKEVIEAEGGRAIMSRVGHSYIKERMRKENAIFAGEVSAHFYYRENSYCESSIMSTLIIMKMMSESGKKLSELVAPLRKYHKTDEINFKVKDKEAKMKELEKIFYDGNVSRLDGIKIEYGDWWFNVRPSNTEPLLRLNLEADTKDLMLKMQNRISKIIQN